MDIKYCPVCSKEQLILGRVGYVKVGDWLNTTDGYENEHSVFEYECLNCKTIFYI